MITSYRHPFRFYIYSAVLPWALWLTSAWLSRKANAADQALHIAIFILVGLQRTQDVL